MDFEQYLEKDILTFLDSKIEHKDNTAMDREEEYGLYLTKDYLKELNYALDNDELTKAKKLFDELKSAYSRLPKTSSERKKIYTLLEKMYGKIQNYVKIKEGKIEVLKQGTSEIQRERSDIVLDNLGKDKEQVNISVQAMSELSPINMDDLPINSASDAKREYDKENKPRMNRANNTGNTSTGGGGKSRGKDGARDAQRDVSVESNILGKSIVDENDRSNQSAQYTRYIFRDDYNKYSKVLLEDIPGANEDFDDLEKNIIERTIELERLKTFVIERLLDALRKKLDEDNNEHNKKIEEMRKDIIEQMTLELDKRFDSGEYSSNSKSYDPRDSIKNSLKKIESTDIIKSVKEDILDKVFLEAPHIISSNDYSDYSNYSTESLDAFSINKNDVIRVRRNDDNSISIIQNGKARRRYDDTKEPNEDIEKKDSYARDDLKGEITSPDSPDKDIAQDKNYEPVENYAPINYSSYSDSDKQDNNIKIMGELQAPEAPETEFNMAGTDTAQVLPAPSLAEPEQKSESTQESKSEFTDEKVQEMYEEAIYTMLQSNYDEAAKIFQNILELRPKNKAARIRLLECVGAAGNA